jgi:metallo-beta-lactamase family protein
MEAPLLKIRCLGAVRTVTGSCYQIENPGGGLTLMDCGLFQGGRQTELRNFNTALYKPDQARAMVITHAHMDHSGLAPRLVAAGFRGPIYASEATCELLEILWLDAASIQEQEAQWKTRKNSRQGQAEVEPLYDQRAAEEAAKLLRPVPFGRESDLGGGLRLLTMPAGHILGAASCLVTAEGGGRGASVLFSGDIGRQGQLIIEDPAIPPQADLVFMETTYGNRLHKELGTSIDELVDVINQAWRDGGKVLIPAFAVERTQELIVLITEAWHKGRIPKEIPVVLDSPLAINASKVYLSHPELYDEQTREMLERGHTPGSVSSLRVTHGSQDSQKLNDLAGPAVIIAGSGMANAGRILHHLKHNLWRPECHVVFVGFQAQGTTGRRLVEGAKAVKLFREPVEVKAKIHTIGGFSAHADQSELIAWLTPQLHPGLTVSLVHGEESSSLAFQAKLAEVFPGLRTLVPRWLETLEVEAAAVAAHPAPLPAAEEEAPELAQVAPVPPLAAESLKRRLERLHEQVLGRGAPLAPDRLAALEELLNQAEELVLRP